MSIKGLGGGGGGWGGVDGEEGQQIHFIWVDVLTAAYNN